MNARHTPGPWRVEVDAVGRPPMHSDVRVLADGSTPDRVRPIARLELQGQETDANAHLIAAAPELLEAAAYAAWRADPYSESYFRLTAGIAKATNRDVIEVRKAFGDVIPTLGAS